MVFECGSKSLIWFLSFWLGYKWFLLLGGGYVSKSLLFLLFLLLFLLGLFPIQIFVTADIFFSISIQFEMDFLFLLLMGALQCQVRSCCSISKAAPSECSPQTVMHCTHSNTTREISRGRRVEVNLEGEGDGFSTSSEFWWSTDNLSAPIFLQGVDQQILPCGQGRIDGV